MGELIKKQLPDTPERRRSSRDDDDADGKGEEIDGIFEREIHRLLVDREKARINRDYSEADRIRDELARHGISIDDRRRVP